MADIAKNHRATPGRWGIPLPLLHGFVFMIALTLTAVVTAQETSDTYSGGDRPAQQERYDAHAACDSKILPQAGFTVAGRVAGRQDECYWLREDIKLGDDTEFVLDDRTKQHTEPVPCGADDADCSPRSSGLSDRGSARKPVADEGTEGAAAIAGQRVFKLHAEKSQHGEEARSPSARSGNIIPVGESDEGSPAPPQNTPVLKGTVTVRQPGICARSPRSYQCLYGNASQPGNGDTRQRPGTLAMPPEATPDGTGMSSDDQSANAPSAANDCVPEPGTIERANLRRTGNELLDTLAAGGSQVDRFFDGMGQAVLTEIAYLSQPQDKIWDQRAETVAKRIVAVVRFLANDNDKRFAELRDQANQAVATFERDPAGILGGVTAGVLTAKTGAGTQQFCAATKNRVTAAIARRADAIKAGKRAKALLKARAEFDAEFGAACGVNPNVRKNACVPSVWAEEINDEIGSGQFSAENMLKLADDVPTSEAQISRTQRHLWGDRRFRGHSKERALQQATGIPARLPGGLNELIREYQAAGAGAYGFAFLKWKNNPTGHVIRVANINGKILFRDAALNRAGGFNFDPGGPAGIPDSIWSYRTRGPDMLPP